MNRKFADKALEVLGEGDYVWVHDYQLMLVPEMIKRNGPTSPSATFAHPFSVL